MTWFPPDGDAAVFFSLGCWARTLCALELHTKDTDVPSDFGWLGCLQQLTLLKLCAWASDPADLRCVSTLPQLRTLDWRVLVENELSEALPLPPALERLWFVAVNDMWTLPAEQLSRLAGLQTLILEDLSRDLLPASLGELTSLTALELRGCDISAGMPSLNGCTGLRVLALRPTADLHASPTAALREALPRLQRLETLWVAGCGLLSLPALEPRPTTPLRLLDTSGNPCAIPSAGWLASLEELCCSWLQASLSCRSCNQSTASATRNVWATQLCPGPCWGFVYRGELTMQL